MCDVPRVIGGAMHDPTCYIAPSYAHIDNHIDLAHLEVRNSPCTSVHVSHPQGHVLAPVHAMCVPSCASHSLPSFSARPTTFIPYLDRLFATILAPLGGRTGVREPGTPKGIQ